MINNQDRFWTLFCRRRRRCWVNIFTTKSLGLFSTLMTDNWALTSVGSITFGRLTLGSSFTPCLCPPWSNFRWSAMLLYANFDGLWWACLLPNSKKLLLYLGKIGVIGLELNSEGNNFSFICCAKQQTILLGVPLAWRLLHDQRLSDLEWSFFQWLQLAIVLLTALF